MPGCVYALDVPPDDGCFVGPVDEPVTPSEPVLETPEPVPPAAAPEPVAAPEAPPEAVPAAAPGAPAEPPAPFMFPGFAPVTPRA